MVTMDQKEKYTEPDTNNKEMLVKIVTICFQGEALQCILTIWLSVHYKEKWDVFSLKIYLTNLMF